MAKKFFMFPVADKKKPTSEVKNTKPIDNRKRHEKVFLMRRIAVAHYAKSRAFFRTNFFLSHFNCSEEKKFSGREWNNSQGYDGLVSKDDNAGCEVYGTVDFDTAKALKKAGVIGSLEAFYKGVEKSSFVLAFSKEYGEYFADSAHKPSKQSYTMLFHCDSHGTKKEALGKVQEEIEEITKGFLRYTKGYDVDDPDNLDYRALKEPPMRILKKIPKSKKLQIEERKVAIDFLYYVRMFYKAQYGTSDLTWDENRFCFHDFCSLDILEIIHHNIAPQLKSGNLYDDYQQGLKAVPFDKFEAYVDFIVQPDGSIKSKDDK